jgi:hypothetical protein
VDTLTAGIILGLGGIIMGLFAYISGRLGAHIGVRGVKRQLGELVDDVESLSARISKVHAARAADKAVEARAADKGAEEAARIIAEAQGKAPGAGNRQAVQFGVPQVIG